MYDHVQTVMYSALNLAYGTAVLLSTTSREVQPYSECAGQQLTAWSLDDDCYSLLLGPITVLCAIQPQACSQHHGVLLRRLLLLVLVLLVLVLLLHLLICCVLQRC
jgi:hypothetical protein